MHVWNEWPCNNNASYQLTWHSYRALPQWDFLSLIWLGIEILLTISECTIFRFAAKSKQKELMCVCHFPGGIFFRPPCHDGTWAGLSSVACTLPLWQSPCPQISWEPCFARTQSDVSVKSLENWNKGRKKNSIWYLLTTTLFKQKVSIGTFWWLIWGILQHIKGLERSPKRM